MPPSRLERLRAMIKDDLEKLPDRPTDSESKLETNSNSAPAPNTQAEGLNSTPVYGPQIMSPAEADELLANEGQHDSDSEDSEADCFVELIPIEDDPLEQRIVEEASEDSDSPVPIPASVVQNGMKLGQVSAAGQSFCPVLSVSKFPYRYISQSDSESVADVFFNAGKFWLRSWDLYYLWPLDNYTDKPLVLIPAEQFVQLFNEINAQFKHLHLDAAENYWREIHLIIDSFPDHPRFRPRYLGCSKSRQEYDDMISKAPNSSFLPKDEPVAPHAPDDRSAEAFRQKVEAAIALNKAKNKVTKAQKREERVIRQQDMGKQLKRAQRYLGLRPKNESALGEISLSIPPIDLDRPAPYPFENSPILICIDVEAYERSRNIITEIGVATLDTRDVTSTPPGEGGEKWFDKIRARHFRIEEHKSYINSEFVLGCADRFEFGTSEFISLKDAPRFLTSCFKHPFSKPTSKEEVAESWNKSLDNQTSASAAVNPPEEEKRNVIFVAHNANSDISFLRSLGFNPLDRPNLLETLDTATLYRAYKRDPNPKAVGTILYDFGLTGWNMHNAGNDAVYTMWVLIGTCVREAAARNKVEAEEERKAKQDAELKQRLKETEERFREEQEGWNSAGEGDDGGEPGQDDIADKAAKLNLGHTGGVTKRGGRGGGPGAGRDDRVSGSLRGGSVALDGPVLDVGIPVSKPNADGSGW